MNLDKHPPVAKSCITFHPENPDSENVKNVVVVFGDLVFVSKLGVWGWLGGLDV
jgi:hypothetical protein